MAMVTSYWPMLRKMRTVPDWMTYIEAPASPSSKSRSPGTSRRANRVNCGVDMAGEPDEG